MRALLLLIPILAAACATAGAPPQKAERPMLLTVDSEKSIDAIRADLPKACEAHRFGVLNVHDLKAKLIEKGQDFDRECLVFDVCNPVKAKRVLETRTEISTALPCRISAFALPGGGTRLATIRPTLLLDLFQTPELQEVAAEVEEAMLAIMRETAR
jgi:uncharacterized protein (DUF302 family)